jgi:hypothetical protein
MGTGAGVGNSAALQKSEELVRRLPILDSRKRSASGDLSYFNRAYHESVLV